MLASGKTPGMLTYSLHINPPTEWTQLSQAAAICNSGPSELKNSVLQAKIGKTLFAKSTAGSGHFIKYEPSIQSLWSSLHSPCVRLFSKGERCRLLTGNGPSATIVNTQDLLYFFPCFLLWKEPPEGSNKRPVTLKRTQQGRSSPIYFTTTSYLPLRAQKQEPSRTRLFGQCIN